MNTVSLDKLIEAVLAILVVKNEKLLNDPADILKGTAKIFNCWQMYTSGNEFYTII
jgi:hypothetical protein